MASSGSTLRPVAPDAGRSATEAGPHLFVALECDRPLARGARLRLSGIAELLIGRGGARELSGDAARPHLSLPDGWLSKVHARLRPVGQHWLLEDAESRHGTLRNGERALRAVLEDGDLIEVGRTLLRFRAALPSSGPAWVDAGPLAPAAPGLLTLQPSLAAQLELLPQIAAAPVDVVVRGETGTGKELIARAVHQLSRRRGKLVAVNCGALPDALVEAELFGWRRGAFSGAVDDRPGLIRSAEGGTLFLDEVGDLAPRAQTALLRALQEREVRPVGSSQAVPVDFRVVAATHRDLDALCAEGAFREDLQVRLRGFEVRLPPLRERREDLGLLVADLLAEGLARRPAPAITPEAGRALLGHAWPGNVRELQKALGAALALCGKGPLELHHLPLAVQVGERGPRAGAAEPDDSLRAELIEKLGAHGGNIAAVARGMGKARTQIHRWLSRFGLDPRSFRR